MELLVAAGATVIIGGLKRLGQQVRKLQYDGIYDGAEDFWYRGVEQEGIAEGSKVKIVGLLSPLAPYMPSHPRAKPGYSIEGWETVSDRLKILMKEQGYGPPDDPLSASGYDAIDLIVWGDAVIRPPLLTGNKVYAGLYNRYGKSYESVPVFLDGQDKSIQQLELGRSYGCLTDVTGVVRKMPSFYESLGMVRPIETPRYPCYCIEVSKVKVLPASKLVLYATAWTGIKDGQIATEFFDFMLADEVRAGIQRLHKRTSAPRKPAWFYYDFVSHPYKDLPLGNKDILAKLSA